MPRSKRQRLMEEYLAAKKAVEANGIPLTGLHPLPAVNPQQQAVTPVVAGTLPIEVQQALRKNWGVPDAAKAQIVASLLEAFYNNETVIDEDGNEIEVKPSKKLLIELARMLRALDQTQYERDHPEVAAKPGSRANNATSVSINMNVQAAAVLRGMVEDGKLGEIGIIEDVSPPAISGPLGDSRQPGEVEASPPLESDQ